MTWLWTGIGLWLGGAAMAWGLLCLIHAVFVRPVRRIRFLIRSRRYWRQHPHGPLPEWAPRIPGPRNG